MRSPARAARTQPGSCSRRSRRSIWTRARRRRRLLKRTAVPPADTSRGAFMDAPMATSRLSSGAALAHGSRVARGLACHSRHGKEARGSTRGTTALFWLSVSIHFPENERMKSVVNPPAPCPNWQAPVSTMKRLAGAIMERAVEGTIHFPEKQRGSARAPPHSAIKARASAPYRPLSTSGPAVNRILVQ